MEKLDRKEIYSLDNLNDEELAILTLHLQKEFENY